MQRLFGKFHSTNKSVFFPMGRAELFFHGTGVSIPLLAEHV